MNRTNLPMLLAFFIVLMLLLIASTVSWLIVANIFKVVLCQ